MKELVKNWWFPSWPIVWFYKTFWEPWSYIPESGLWILFWRNVGYESYEIALITSGGLFLFLITAPNTRHSVTRYLFHFVGFCRIIVFQNKKGCCSLIKLFKHSISYVFVVIFELDLISNPEHGTPFIIILKVFFSWFNVCLSANPIQQY